jgi:hypothetical protein
MPDEGLAPEAETQDTPINAAPEEGKPAEAPAGTDNWEQRYNDLRPEFDRRNALLTAAEGQQGPEAQAQALRQLGIEVQLEEEEEEQPDPFEDPYEKRIGTLEQRLAAKEEAEQQAEADATEQRLVKDALTGFEKDGNVKLTDREKKIIENNALVNRFQFRSVDDLNAALKGAYDDLVEVKKAAQEEYRTSKNTPLPPVGSAGEEKLDTRNPEQRRAFMLKDFEARQAADQGS